MCFASEEVVTLGFRAWTTANSPRGLRVEVKAGTFRLEHRIRERLRLIVVRVLREAGLVWGYLPGGYRCSERPRFDSIVRLNRHEAKRERPCSDWNSP